MQDSGRQAMKQGRSRGQVHCSTCTPVTRRPACMLSTLQLSKLRSEELCMVSLFRGAGPIALPFPAGGLPQRSGSTPTPVGGAPAGLQPPGAIRTGPGSGPGLRPPGGQFSGVAGASRHCTRARHPRARQQARGSKLGSLAGKTLGLRCMGRALQPRTAYTTTRYQLAGHRHGCSAQTTAWDR